jgi:hypothetical protein
MATRGARVSARALARRVAGAALGMSRAASHREAVPSTKPRVPFGLDVLAVFLCETHALLQRALAFRCLNPVPICVHARLLGAGEQMSEKPPGDVLPLGDLFHAMAHRERVGASVDRAEARARGLGQYSLDARALREQRVSLAPSVPSMPSRASAAWAPRRGVSLLSRDQEVASRARAEVAKIRAAAQAETPSIETQPECVTERPAPLVRKPRKKRGRRLLR